tara:strand:- start:1413 stop:2033 length:621 start_codon:yes stop_codon:yes gene_type:complete
MKKSKNLDDLIDALTMLPGVGKKSAQRMAYKILRSNKEKTLNLSRQLQKVLTDVVTCNICGVYLDKQDAEIQQSSSEHLCIGKNRDNSIICITESPADIYIIEDNTNYNGDYFALKGTLSPLDGLGPEEIGIFRLQNRLEKENIKELILATSTTIEGEATAHYIQNICHELRIKVSRIAFGIPLNGELGYLDGETISHAFNERKEL